MRCPPPQKSSGYHPKEVTTWPLLSVVWSPYRDEGAREVRSRKDEFQIDFSRNGRFREECLNAHWFESMEDAQDKVDAWRWDYNEHRPHRSLMGLTPMSLRQMPQKGP
jgi:transposase InsO family protein